MVNVYCYNKYVNVNIIMLYIIVIIIIVTERAQGLSSCLGRLIRQTVTGLN